MFSSQTVPIRGDFFRRGSDETDESQFSSGLTTPVDDEVLQPFDRLVLEDPSCNAELRSSTKLGSGDCVHSKDSGSATAPKSRSLSKAVMKAKRFAQYLAKSNRFKKANSISELNLAAPPFAVCEDVRDIPSPTCDSALIISTTPTEHGHDTNVNHLNQTIFAQPNQPIEQLDFTPDVVRRLSSADSILDSGDTFETPLTPSPLLAQPNCQTPESAAWRIITLSDAQVICTKVFFFLPWCVLLGATIVLFPTYLEPIAFGPWPGYHLTPGASSPKGIYRFAHWADCAIPHIMIFLACLAILTWYSLSLGVFVGAGVLAQFMHAWGDFRLDRSVMLGEDDRQSIYLVCVKGGLEDGVVIEQTEEGGYLAVQDYSHNGRPDEQDEN